MRDNERKRCQSECLGAIVKWDASHQDNRMKVVVSRSLIRRNDGVFIILIRNIQRAAVTALALYGSDVCWKGQQNPANKLQMLMNSKARAIAGMLKSTPVLFHKGRARLPYAIDVLSIENARCTEVWSDAV